MFSEIVIQEMGFSLGLTAIAGLIAFGVCLIIGHGEKQAKALAVKELEEPDQPED